MRTQQVTFSTCLHYCPVVEKYIQTKHNLSPLTKGIWSWSWSFILIWLNMRKKAEEQSNIPLVCVSICERYHTHTPLVLMNPSLNTVCLSPAFQTRSLEPLAQFEHWEPVVALSQHVNVSLKKINMFFGGKGWDKEGLRTRVTISVVFPGWGSSIWSDSNKNVCYS